MNIVCAFDEKAIENGPFAGVEGVGEKGYPYFRNRCFIMARAGTDEETVAQLKELYDKILADEEVVTWLQDTMLLEVDTMSQDDVNAHVENVKSIVNEYKDLVARLILPIRNNSGMGWVKSLPSPFSVILVCEGGF